MKRGMGFQGLDGSSYILILSNRVIDGFDL